MCVCVCCGMCLTSVLTVNAVLPRCDVVAVCVAGCRCQDVEIKNQGHSLSFAFVQFDNIRSVVTALRDMDSEQIGLNKVKVSDSPQKSEIVLKF